MLIPAGEHLRMQYNGIRIIFLDPIDDQGECSRIESILRNLIEDEDPMHTLLSRLCKLEDLSKDMVNGALLLLNAVEYSLP